MIRFYRGNTKTKKYFIAKTKKDKYCKEKTRKRKEESYENYLQWKRI